MLRFIALSLQVVLNVIVWELIVAQFLLWVNSLINCYKINSLFKFKAVSKRLSTRNRWVNLFKQVSPVIVINHAASEKYSKRSIRKQHLSRISYIKRYQFKFIHKTTITIERWSGKFRKRGGGERQLVFRWHDLPIHHLVADWYRGEVELGVLARDLLQSGVEPDSKDLGGALLELFGLFL